MERRIVISAMGCLSPLGGLNATWQAIKDGTCGISVVPEHQQAGFRSIVAGKINAIPEIPPDSRFGMWLKKQAKKMDRATLFGMSAFADLLARHPNALDGLQDYTRIGVAYSPSLGNQTSNETLYDLYKKEPTGREQAFAVVKIMPNALPNWLSIFLGAKGPSICSVSACATGLSNIIRGVEQILLGRADAMFVGGVEALTQFTVNGFDRIKALSPSTDSATACRPFDQARNGFVIAEGAAVLMIENLEHAKRRGASSLAEIIGFYESCDAHDITYPESNTQVDTILATLTSAGLGPSQIDSVSAHATATTDGDISEAIALAQTLATGNTPTPPVWSIKSMIGHMMGAAGAIETQCSVLSLIEQMIPGNRNLDDPDPACGNGLLTLPQATYQPDHPINHLLKLSFGFGGNNACLVFKRFNL